MVKYVEFELDKVRHFRMGMMAQKRIEEKFKKPFAKIEHDNLTVDDFAFMLWATMEQSERESITPSQFLEVLDENATLKEIYGLFGKITEEAFGKNEQPPEVEEILEEQEENGTGTKQYKTLSDAE
jgi:hypothetical protein